MPAPVIQHGNASRLHGAAANSDQEQKYLRELGEVGHLDSGPASQDLHQLEAFVRLESTGDEEEEMEER
ncbi:hypothetical protein EYF80_013874 [Liparis tanakae]|uniref:Uncharacterized protein n=1 Tax=Liparis tanakae TaxID=230148 RepID=A0A4Z2IEM9_9TELE|nr:hypothetical protein EYF80_013874 [Liparis tanakae]